MKAVCKKLFSLMLVAILLVSAVPFQAFAAETEETAAVATEEVVTEEVVATSPVANAEVVEKDVVYVEFQLPWNGTEYRVGSLVKSKIGSTVSTPSASKVLEVLKSVIGTSAGYELVRWELEDSTTFTSSTVLNLSMDWSDSYYDEKTETDYPLVHVNAIVQEAAKTITLNANGGVCSISKYTVKIGEQYDYAGGLPAPTRNHYDFAGWAKSDGTIVANEDIVTDLSTLTAQWTPKKYTVTFQAYTDPEGTDKDGWEEAEFGPFTVDANSTLKIAYNNWPTSDQINEIFLGSDMYNDGWYIDYWQILKTGESFVAGSTKVTTNIVIRPVYKKTITLHAQDEGHTTRKLTVTLGKPVPALPNPGARDGYTFTYWYDEIDDIIAYSTTLSDLTAHPYYYPAMGNFYAEWTESTLVYLYIYVDGKTTTPAKMVKYYDAPANGTFYFSNIDMYDIYANYGKYDDDCDEQYGWYTSTQWDRYLLGKPANQLEYVNLGADGQYEEDDIYEFYIMLINNGTGSGSSNSGSANGNGYNDNSSTVDSSNPTTGDTIFVPMTIMAVSAGVLFLFFLNKKRAVK